MEQLRQELAERETIYQRSLFPNTILRIEPTKSKALPDGTELIYYRRKDGSLIRSVEKSDGTVRRWVIGWIDPTPYISDPNYVNWRDE